MSEQVTFDHYEVLTRGDGSLHELGRGAMGITYKAFDSNLRIPVALKVINVPDLTSDIARGRFVREARAAAKLRHRHVASVFHLGVQGDTYFYAMEFIDGETVEALVKRRGPLPELVALQLCLQVTRALTAAEQYGLVHRDLKPSNLMLVREDDELCAKVIDFGLAQCQLSEDEDGRSFSTTTTGFMGTPLYASPEQLEEKAIDQRSDIYSLGATLWFMLAGVPPFSGPVARVVSQHLTVEPPYEHLAGCSPETIALLRKMLAKNREERFQKAAEVRQEIERTSEVLAGGPVAAAARLALEEARMEPPPAADREVGDYPPGTTVAERYEILEALGATNHGWQYHARDIVEQREVRLMLTEIDPVADRATVTQLENEMTALSQVDHPSVLRVYGMETVENRVIIALEWTTSFTLLQVLRSRRKLGAGEVMRLLELMAAGVDHAIANGLDRIDLGLHQIHVVFAEPAEDQEERMRQPIEEWPPFTLKLNPMAISCEISQSETWAGGQTLVGRGPEAAAVGAPVNPGVAHTRSLAVLIYELLGGSVSPLLAANASMHGIARYSPLANLTEEGNEVLQSALDPDGPFRNAGEFYRALSAVDELEDRHFVEKPEPAARRPDGTHFTLPEQPAPPRPLPVLPPKPKRTPWALIAAALVVLAGGGVAAYLLLHGPEDGKNGTYASNGTNAHVAPPSTEPDAPPARAEATPNPATPAPATPAPATPPPPPSRRDLLKVATADAEKIEEQGDTTKAIDTWTDVARNFPESEIGKLRLEIILNALRAKASEYAGPALTKLDEQLREAARLEVVSAMMMLGDLWREKQPEEAFKWFSTAAAKGVPAAATQVGLMLSNGMGTERDLVKAVEYFQSAADKGDAAAKAALGECLLYGKGVEKDVPRAIELFEQAASRSNPRALNRLGTCYHQGVGVKQDFEEARRLFKKASDLGSTEALGNLGVLYINGDGVPKSEAKAVEYFQRGAEANDGYCMYLYARCFESGTVVTPNPETAKLWYKKAAAAGVIKAIEWCKKSGVKY
jgi:serine/threonine protein kinase/TPR repeat protein